MTDRKQALIKETIAMTLFLRGERVRPGPQDSWRRYLSAVDVQEVRETCKAQLAARTRRVVREGKKA